MIINIHDVEVIISDEQATNILNQICVEKLKKVLSKHKNNISNYNKIINNDKLLLEYINLHKEDIEEHIEITFNEFTYELGSELNKKEEVLIQVEDGTYVFLQFGFGNETIDGCDSYIDYTVFSSEKAEVDGGNMDYNSEEINYETIEDAIEDILEFAGYEKGVKYEILPDEYAEDMI